MGIKFHSPPATTNYYNARELINGLIRTLDIGGHAFLRIDPMKVEMWTKLAAGNLCKIQYWHPDASCGSYPTRPSTRFMLLMLWKVMKRAQMG